MPRISISFCFSGRGGFHLRRQCRAFKFTRPRRTILSRITFFFPRPECEGRHNTRKRWRHRGATHTRNQQQFIFIWNSTMWSKNNYGRARGPRVHCLRCHPQCARLFIAPHQMQIKLLESIHFGKFFFSSAFFPIIFRLFLARRASLSFAGLWLCSLVMMAAFCTQLFFKTFFACARPLAREHFYVRINYETSFQRSRPPGHLLCVCGRLTETEIDRRRGNKEMWRSVLRTKLLFSLFSFLFPRKGPFMHPGVSPGDFHIHFLIVYSELIKRNHFPYSSHSQTENTKWINFDRSTAENYSIKCASGFISSAPNGRILAN